MRIRTFRTVAGSHVPGQVPQGDAVATDAVATDAVATDAVATGDVAGGIQGSLPAVVDVDVDGDARFVDLLRTAISDDADRRARLGALGATVPLLARRARAAGVRAVAAGSWLVEVIEDVAPHIPIRDVRSLRAHFPGLTDDQIAERLVTNATRVTAALGAAAGGLAAVEFTAPPTLLAAPVQLAAELVMVAAAELKLVAELHEIYGRAPTGSARDRAGLYLTAWVRRRAVGQVVASTGLGGVLGASAKRELRQQILRRLGRSTTKLTPFFVGAVVGAQVNRRTTSVLGQRLVAQLRAHPGAAALVVEPVVVEPADLGPAGEAIVLDRHGHRVR